VERDIEMLLPGAEYALTGSQIEQQLEPLLSTDEDEYEYNEQQIIEIIHKESSDIAVRKAIYRTDLFYDMFPTFTSLTRERLWCMNDNHPIAYILQNINNDDRYGNNICLSSKRLESIIIFWPHEQLQDAIDYIFHKCKEYNLPVQDQDQDFELELNEQQEEEHFDKREDGMVNIIIDTK